MEAADAYFAKTGRRITYEYVVLSEVNDGPEQAEDLAKLLEGRQAHMNLIPHNSVTELPYADPSGNRLRKFIELLTERGVNVTVRKRKGADIDAACGHLRLRHEQGRKAVVTVGMTRSRRAARLVVMSERLFSDWKPEA